jgi:hypothetical protein
VQGAAARADEDELGVDPDGGAADLLADVEVPGAVRVLRDAAHVVVEVQGRAVLGEVVDELVGEGAEVDVGAALEPRGGDDLGLVALQHEERRPGVDDRRVLRVLHVGEEGVRAQRLVATAEVVGVLLPADERHVRGGVDELLGLRDRAGGDQVRPELAGELELLVDAGRRPDLDPPVLLRRVVQLAEGRVPGPRVVPRVAGLHRDLAQALEYLDGPVRLELLDEGSERGAHDPAPDEDDVYRFR